MNKLDAYIRNTLHPFCSGTEAAWLSRIICCEMLGQSQTDYYLGKDMDLSVVQKENVDDVLRRLCSHEPIQYIQGKALFCGREFCVSPEVLIPRPETEEMVELIVKENNIPSPSVLDVGTGSGCIAISLKLGIPAASVRAFDISAAALRIAESNAARLDADVSFEKQDIIAFDPADSCNSLDLLVSNPPYVTECEKKDMDRNVLDWEPATALFVPDDDPLLFYRKIAQVGSVMLKHGGRLYLEINRAYGHEVADLLGSAGYTDVEVRKDMSGNDRFVSAAR